jgi:hypothetical protein
MKRGHLVKVAIFDLMLMVDVMLGLDNSSGPRILCVKPRKEDVRLGSQMSWKELQDHQRLCALAQ